MGKQEKREKKCRKHSHSHVLLKRNAKFSALDVIGVSRGLNQFLVSGRADHGVDREGWSNILAKGLSLLLYRVSCAKVLISLRLMDTHGHG